MIRGHGDDIHGGKEIKANFSTNIHYLSTHEWLKDLLSNCCNTIKHYPEPDAYSLKKEIAEHHNISSKQIIVGNGATEIFYLIAQYFKKQNTLISVPSFSEYEDACNIYEHNIDFCEHNDILKQKKKYKLTIICNPNNPNGFIYSLNYIEDILKKDSSAHLLIDEAFIDFTDEIESATSILDKYPNLLISRSMTKNYAIPGLRLGYLIGHKNTIEEIEKYKQPWTINSIAIEVGKFVLQNSKNLLPNTSLLNKNRIIFQKQIDKIEGFNTLESSAPFFLVKTKYNSSDLKQYLIDKHRILIRDASNFRTLNNNYFRLNTLDKERNTLLIKALKNYGK